jgi:hypothetical protein
LSKLTKAYLAQGKKKFDSVVAVEMSIKKAMSFPVPVGCDEWEIFLDMDDVSSLYKAWQKNSKFRLYIEYTAKENGKPLVETVCGEIMIESIVPNGISNRPHSVRGFSKVLKMSSKEEFVREKVQFT